MSDIILYTDLHDDICTPEATYAEKKDAFDGEGNLGQWASPLDVSDNVTKLAICARLHKAQEERLDALRFASDGRPFVVVYHDVHDGHSVRGMEMTKYPYRPFAVSTSRDRTPDTLNNFSLRVTDHDGVLIIDVEDADGKGSGMARLLTAKGESLYAAWTMADKELHKQYQTIGDIYELMFSSDEYSEKPRFAEKLKITKSPEFMEKPDIKIMTPEENRKLLLDYRPKRKDMLADSAYKARLGLIENPQLRDAAKKMTSEDADFKALFMGYDFGVYPEKNAADTAYKLAEKMADKSEYSSASLVEIFKASAWGEGVSNHNAERMCEEAYDIVRDYNTRVGIFKSNTENKLKREK
ncbi:MAG: hypothetical protein LUD72_01925 [Bacteroidales bacterium]|nr:hypothetical protein [Bacteroidales bacterium]